MRETIWEFSLGVSAIVILFAAMALGARLLEYFDAQ